MVYFILQVGQCGNQIGYELIATLFEHLDNAQRRTFFRRDGTARALQIDTENRVIESNNAKCAKNKEQWAYARESAIVDKSKRGSGNNWACGYFDKTHLRDRIVKKLDREIERTEYEEGESVDAFIIIQRYCVWGKMVD